MVRSAAAFVTSLFLLVTSLPAQESGGAKWENTVTVYGWAAAMSGTESINGITATVDVPFSDILDNLKMGAMLNYLGRGETLVAGFDLIYMKLGSDVAAPNTGNTLAEVTLKQWLIEANGGYQVTPWLDALVGIRYPIIEAEITPDREDPPISEKSGSESWLAPIVGARAHVPLGKKFTAIVRGDVGGFDLGGTNWTWQAAGYVDYRFSHVVSALVGYRAIAADYANNADVGAPGYFAYDITNFGGVLGVSFTF